MTAILRGSASRIRSALASSRHFVSDLLFERRFHVKTSGKLILEGHDTESICYVPISWRRLRQVLPPNTVSGNDVFIDIGSGMGRAVLEAAAYYPLARVIGVEMNRQLHEIAEQNFDQTTRRLRCRNVELVNADIREYGIPDDVTIVFMNNAIRGSIFAWVLDEISASVARSPRGVRLVYASPLEDEAVMATGRWRKVRTIRPRSSSGPHGATCVYEHLAPGDERSIKADDIPTTAAG